MGKGLKKGPGDTGEIGKRRISDVSEYSTGAGELIFRAALLAGLGSNARPLADGLRCEGVYSVGSPGRLRTCVDAGSRMMFSVLAPGGRELRVLVRLSPVNEGGGVCRWLRVCQKADGYSERWETETFMRERDEAWRNTVDLARSAGCENVLQRYHAAIGPRARIFGISRPLGGEAAGVWVTWQLDRHCTPRDALTACGAGGVWPRAAELFRMLLGRNVSERSRPWSISWNLLTEYPHVRIGSTVWARQQEDRGKCRRMVATVEHMGGDGRFAEGLYKMLGASPYGGMDSRVGRAAEVELRGDRVLAMEFYLCTAQKLYIDETGEKRN